MSQMHPTCATEAELEALIPKGKHGWKGERRLYCFFRDWMPKDWDVFYNQRIPDKDKGERQLDFVVLVPQLGALNMDAKGDGYFLEDGNVLFSGHGVSGKKAVDIYDAASGAAQALDRFVRDTVSGGEAWGAYDYFVVFTEGDAVASPGSEKSGHAFSIAGCDGHPQETAAEMEKRIRQLLGKHPKKMAAQFAKYALRLGGTFGVSKIPRKDSLQFVGWERVTEGCLLGKQCEVASLMAKYDVCHVAGAAGTGKTLVALALAKRFAKEGKRTLLVCYARLLEEFLQRKIAVNGKMPPNLTIQRFYEAPGLFGKDVGFDLNFDAGWRQRADARIGVALDQMGEEGARQFDVVLVDEAQDFNRAELQSLMRLARPNRKVVLFSDFAQTVFWYDGKGPRWDGELDVLFPSEQVGKMTLTVNYRNAKPIHEKIAECEAERTEAFWNEETMGTAPVPVRFVKKSDVKELVKGILCREEGATLRDLAFLTYDEEEYAQFRDFPDGRGGCVAFTEDLTEWEDGKGILKKKAKRFKGLEANIVFLFGSKQRPVAERYVGESRAKWELYLVD